VVGDVVVGGTVVVDVDVAVEAVVVGAAVVVVDDGAVVAVVSGSGVGSQAVAASPATRSAPTSTPRRALPMVVCPSRDTGAPHLSLVWRAGQRPSTRT
jgi:hypothetical protein